MVRKLVLSITLLSAGLALGAPLTPEEALDRLNDNGFMPHTRSVFSGSPAMIVSTRIGEPALYVFENSDSRGFKIVSADDGVTPLLGYSDTDEFDIDNMPPALTQWLQQYAEQIEYIREKFPEAKADRNVGVTLPNWSPIEPLVKTLWGQGTPFNNLCPKYSTGVKTVTGCVATSMSQVMNYFKYPEKGRGKISYWSNDVRKTLKLDLDTLVFDWKNMIDNYTGSYTATQATAVAELMQAAGYSVNMSYTETFSGALSGLISGAMINYFNYDPGLRYEKRNAYTYTDWATKIYDNLKNIGPVIYDGNSATGAGHSFVCDGFQDGYFHFNWGWNGTSNGYYLLDALNPSAVGTGGGDGGYNFMQDVLFGIQPPTGKPATEQDDLVLYGSIQGFINSDNELSMNVTGGGSYNGWAYNGTSFITVSIGASFVPVDNPSATPIYKLSTNGYNIEQTLKPGEFLPNEAYDNYGRPTSCRPTFPLSELGLSQNVKYKVTNVGLDVDDDKWLPFISDVGCYNYFYITKTGNGNTASDYKIETWDPMQYKCDKLALTSTLYNGIAVDVSTTLTNNNDTELTRGVTLLLLNNDGVVQYKGETTLITMAPGETTTLEWTTLLTSLTGGAISKKTEFYPALYDTATETIYYTSTQTVTMEPFPGTPVYSCTITVEDAEFRAGKYYVKDSSNFNVKSKINVTRNIFSYPVALWVSEKVVSGNGATYYKVLSFPYDIQVIDQGDSFTFSSTVNFPDAEIGKTYSLLCYINKGAQGAIEFIAEGNGAGVEELVSAENEISFIHNKYMDSLVVTGGEEGISSVEVYALNGMKLTPSVSGFGERIQIDLSTLGKGIVVVTAIDGKGNRKSQKLAL